MHYQTVFDISTAGYKSASFPYHGLMLLGFGILFVIFRYKQLDLKNSRYNRIFLFIWIGFGIFWTVTAFMSTYSQYNTLLSDYNKGAYQVVEGHVTNFVPMPYTGHAMERFCVDNSTCFEYSDFIGTAGFNNAKSHGGPITEGLPVRVSYIGNTILKLEVGMQ